MDFVGVDGCRAGWFYVGFTESGESTYGIAADASALGAIAARARIVLVDVPIGLKEHGETERVCDLEARRVLGRPRASSVFRVPTRQAVAAPGYEAGSAANYRITGKRLSRQTWGICAKIREIDALLQSRPRLRIILREMHPEVCFWSLNGRRPASHNKKSMAGRRERLDVLARYFPHARSIAETAAKTYRRQDVAWDDIVDALAGAVTARLGYRNFSTLPASPERDRCGFAMEVVFTAPP